MSGDIKSLVGCHPEETLQCCQVLLVLFSGIFSGHQLLALNGHFLPRVDGHYTCLSQLTPYMWAPSWWRLRSELPWAMKGAGTFRLRLPQALGMKGCRSWDCYCFAVMDEDEGWNWWCYEGSFRFEITWQGHRLHILSNILLLANLLHCCICSIDQGAPMRRAPSRKQTWSG